MRAKKLYELEILRLESKREAEFNIIKRELKEGFEYIQPVNIIKRTLNQAAKSPEIKGDLFSIALNYATGYLTNKVVPGKSGSKIKEWISSFIQNKLSSYIGGNSDDPKLKLEKFALNILTKISRNSTSQEEKETDEDHQLSKSAA